ncbi:hypothetical protein BASA82_001161 [Batrachochytrium salamandrivorans]|nr:hypothetical protein BASA62_004445 [Batrachochytrium salamandrivorans]KAH9260500.1 hypothetical protein BASA82_001161 [Batrachochytrium salamandrivorans]
MASNTIQSEDGAVELIGRQASTQGDEEAAYSSLEDDLLGAEDLAKMEAEQAALDIQIEQMKKRKLVLQKQAEMREQLRQKKLEVGRLQVELSHMEKCRTSTNREPAAVAGNAYICDTQHEATKRRRLPDVVSDAKNIQTTLSQPTITTTISTHSTINNTQQAHSRVKTKTPLSAIDKGRAIKRQPLGSIKTAMAAPASVVDLTEDICNNPPMTIPSTDSDIGQIEIEVNTELRIKNRTVTETDLKGLMLNRQLIAIPKIRGNMSDDDIFGDWVVMGVIVFKSGNKKTTSGDPYCMMRIGDMRGATVNLFMFRDVFQAHSKERVGSLVAILNPKIIKPSESRSTLGLDLDHIQKWLKIGEAVDLGYCEGTPRDGKSCLQPIDSRLGKYCSDHLSVNYKAARSNRQELASGTAGFYVGNPSAKLAVKGKTYTSDGNYVLSGHTVTSNGDTIDAVKQRKEFSEPVLCPEQVREIKSLMASHTHGSKALRALSKDLMPQSSTGMASIFGPSAIARMGGNPIVGDGFKPKSIPKAASLPIIGGKKLASNTKPAVYTKEKMATTLNSRLKSDLARNRSNPLVSQASSPEKRKYTITENNSPTSSDVELEILD